MFNAPLLFETALLMLAAFLVGAVLGTVARWVLARPKPAVASVSAASESPVPAGPPLVVAPEIVAVAARPTVAERVAAAAEGRSAATPSAPTALGMSATVAMPRSSLPDTLKLSPIAPAHAPGETVDGRHIENPEKQPAPSAVAPDPMPPATASVPNAAEVQATKAEGSAEASEVESVELEPDTSTPDSAERVEPAIATTPLELLDTPEDLAQDLQRPHPVAPGEPQPEVAPETPLVEPQVERDIAEADETLLARVETDPAPMDEADAELAAMRAIESGWTPRPTATPRVAAELPEPMSMTAANDADRAVAGAGAAVAQALARANAVLAEIAPPDAPVEDDAQPEAPPAEPGASRPVQRGGFGRPPALEAPRDGAPDELTAIRGINPTIAAALNGLGIFHFDQVAAWDQKAVVWVENHFGFKGRVARERWQDQARDLARGRPASPRRIRR